VLESELVKGETGRVGARYRQRVKQGRREMTVQSELTQAEPPRTIAFRTVDSGPITASGTYEIRATADGTHVVVDVAVEARGFMRVFEPMMGPTLRKTAERYERDLARRLAGEQQDR
jgi:hypothetical protein